MKLLAATGLVALATVLSSSCSGSSGERGASSEVPTVETSTSSSSSTSSSTTMVSTTTPARPTTTSPASSPEGHAQALYLAWTEGDRVAANEVAEPEAVSALFARQWQASDGWSFAECSGAAGSVICTWQRPSGQQLLLRVQNTTGGLPVTVSDVRFQP